MAKLGSNKRPIVLRAATDASARQAIAICERFGWRYIVGIEPDQPEDFRDLNRALAAAGELAPGEGMIPLVHLDRELAKRETRSAIVPRDQPGLPADDYGFTEAYCVDPACDCRRVLIQVFSRKREAQVASINYGFDPPGRDAEEQLFLDPLNPQSEISETLLALFEELLQDEAYRLRLERHYEHVKALPRERPQSRLRAPEATAPRVLRAEAAARNPGPAPGRERVFVFDPRATRLLGEVEGDRWERAIAAAGGQVARAAAACGIAEAVPGARALRARSTDEAMAAYRRGEERRRSRRR